MISHGSGHISLTLQVEMSVPLPPSSHKHYYSLSKDRLCWGDELLPQVLLASCHISRPLLAVLKAPTVPGMTGARCQPSARRHVPKTLYIPPLSIPTSEINQHLDAPQCIHAVLWGLRDDGEDRKGMKASTNSPGWDKTTQPCRRPWKTTNKILQI